MSGVVYVVSYLLLQALSRDREFAADRGSALITGRPSALASALLKISNQMDQIPHRRPAGGIGRAGRLLHLPAEGQVDRGDAVLDPPADRGPPRGAGPVRVPAPGHRPLGTGLDPPAWDSSTACSGRRKLAQPAEDRLFAISTAYVTFETGLQITSRGSAYKDPPAAVAEAVDAGRGRQRRLFRALPAMTPIEPDISGACGPVARARLGALVEEVLIWRSQ